MFTQGFGEVITDILTVNPGFSELPAASSILDTSNYTFQAVTYGKDAQGYNYHGHVVSSVQYTPSNDVSGYNDGFIIVRNYVSGSGGGDPVVSAIANSYTTSVVDSFLQEMNIMPNYPHNHDTRLERGSTRTTGASSFSSAPFAAITSTEVAEIFTYDDVLLLPSASEYNIDDRVTFATCSISPPSGLVEGVQYWVVGVDKVVPFAIRVSDTKGGVPIIPGPSLEFFRVVRVGSSDLGHYSNAAVDPDLSGIWNIIGGFPPSGNSSKYYVFSGDSNSKLGFAISGTLSGVYNEFGLVDKEGYVTVNPIKGLGQGLSSTTNEQGSDLSAGVCVFSGEGNSASNAISNLVVVPQMGDAASLLLFGSCYHIGVYCLDLKEMLSLGITPPYSWDALNNSRKYKLVGKVSFWEDIIRTRSETAGADFILNGINLLANIAPIFTFENKGPSFVLKFNFL